MKLTDTRIRNVKLPSKNTRLADGGGLYLLVTPAGGKLWRWKYRFEGKEKLMSFGGYPEVSLAAAREKHSAARKLLKDGTDPMAQRKAVRVAEIAAEKHAFQKIAEQWHKHWKVGKSERHADAVLRRLQADVFPAIGAKAISAIEAPTIVAMVKAIEERGAHDIAKRALETTGQVFRYAIAHGYVTRNPSADFKPADVLKSVQKTNYARIDAKELPALLRAVELYQGTPVTRLAIKLLAHTFVRTGELIGACWSEIDFEEKRWNIPAERMKMRTPHIIPLSTQAIEILELLKNLTGDGTLLFPGDRSPKKSMSNGTILVALKRMGYQGVMTGHGFRGLASTVLHEQGFEHAHIELQLAHSPRNAVSAAYNHALYLSPRAKMMQWWSNYLEAQQRGKVLKMRTEVA
ncbi:integrase arm-type DNA-binding domain-containing protein [Terriglobus sp. TAA 43]|uniref:tyrosine-type recombinase/integrase n=1 Tax=Terriglobus sp. TAA 43 TaxID=278961 RepID=UPI000648F763|nr:integrase arm-type DNA-binding domain-containing protein [Terriglobus sp. TAA 43]